MTQLFADDEQLDESFDGASHRSVAPRPPMIRPRMPVDGHPGSLETSLDTSFDTSFDTSLGTVGGLGGFGPALTAGKGVRAIRCVGCSEPTLPRADDNAPLCARCSDLLDGSQPRSSSLFSGRWRRRR